jgi:hypothetical protein
MQIAAVKQSGNNPNYAARLKRYESTKAESDTRASNEQKK